MTRRSGRAQISDTCPQDGWANDAYKPDPPRSRDPRLNPGDDYISSDTGLSCKSVGGTGICGPPRGAMHYRSEEGLNCTRTGLVSVCTNF